MYLTPINLQIASRPKTSYLLVTRQITFQTKRLLAKVTKTIKLILKKLFPNEAADLSNKALLWC